MLVVTKQLFQWSFVLVERIIVGSKGNEMVEELYLVVVSVVVVVCCV